MAKFASMTSKLQHAGVSTRQPRLLPHRKASEKMSQAHFSLILSTQFTCCCCWSARRCAHGCAPAAPP